MSRTKFNVLETLTIIQVIERGQVEHKGATKKWNIKNIVSEVATSV